jgi:uncharacterized protein (TIGR03790 family)
MTYVDARGTKVAGSTKATSGSSAPPIPREPRHPVVMDNGEGLFPSVYPMTHAAGYLGWYADHVTGPFLEPAFAFERGAVAVHIHSFSASSLRNPKQFCVRRSLPSARRRPSGTCMSRTLADPEPRRLL